MPVIHHQLLGYSVRDKVNLLQIINQWQEYPKNFLIIPTDILRALAVWIFGICA